MGKRIVVAVAGKAGSGKDTASDLLVEELGGGGVAVKRAFAKPLKDICKIFGFTDAQLHDPVLKEVVDPFWGVTPRYFIQLVGTQMFRNLFREDCWCKLMERFLLDNPNTHVVISDARYDNEAQVPLNAGGVVVRLERDGAGLKGDVAKHSSEAGVDAQFVKHVVDNNGTIEELRERMRSILAGLGHTAVKQVPDGYDALVHFDGSCMPVNPGGTAKYGFSIVWNDGKGEISWTGQGVVGSGEGMTNNVAEWAGLQAAMASLLERSAGQDEMSRVLVRGDSQLVIRQASGDWRIRAENLLPYKKAVDTLEVQFEKVDYEWVPRAKNAVADELSR